LIGLEGRSVYIFFFQLKLLLLVLALEDPVLELLTLEYKVLGDLFLVYELGVLGDYFLILVFKYRS